MVTQEGTERFLEVGEIAVEATVPVGDREEVPVLDPLDHGNLSGLLELCPVNRGKGCLFVDGERLDVTPKFSMYRVPLKWTPETGQLGMLN